MSARRVAIIGAAGQLGSQLVRASTFAGDQVRAFGREDLDITRSSDLRRLTAWRPDVVVNSAAWTDVDGCARDPDQATRINGLAAGEVARAAAAAGALIVQMSTNEVFDGALRRPYREDDPPNPINPYGASKLVGEQAVADGNERHLIVRTAWLYGAGDRNFPGRIKAAAARMLKEARPVRVVADEWGNPTQAGWLAETLLHLVELKLAGAAKFATYHLVGEPPASRLEWATAILRDSPVAIEPIGLDQYRRASRAPARAVLDSDRVRLLGITPRDWRTDFPGR